MFGAFFQVWHVDPRVYSLKFGGTKNWLTEPDRGLSNEVEESLSGDVSSNTWNLWFIRNDAWDLHLLGPCCKKVCSTKVWLFSIDFVRFLQHWSIFPFISCRSKEAGTKYVRHLVIILKIKCLWATKRINLRFRRTKGNAFGHGFWRVSTNFASWVLMMPLVHLTSPENYRW